MLSLFINTYIKLFFLLTPFFVLSTFLSFTSHDHPTIRHRIALRTTLAILIITFILYLFGRYLFDLFGITLDAFRIGAGSLLFISAISLVRGNQIQQPPDSKEDIAVVPLAIPITVGPGTIGALMVLSTEITGLTPRLTTCAALFLAVLSVGLLLLLAGSLKRILGSQGLAVLSKLTGLIISAIAAQIIFTGIRNFLS